MTKGLGVVEISTRCVTLICHHFKPEKFRYLYDIVLLNTISSTRLFYSYDLYLLFPNKLLYLKYKGIYQYYIPVDL